MIWPKAELSCSYPDESHTCQKKNEVKDLGLDIPFFENDHSADERYDHGTASYQRYYRNHGIRVIKGGEISEISYADEDRDQRYGPAPSEWSRLFSGWPPYESADDAHYYHLIKIEPALDEHGTQ